MTLSAIGRAWSHHRRLVLGCMVLGVLAAFFLSRLSGDSYATQATVILSASNYDEQFGPLGTLNAYEFDQAMSTKLALARSANVRVVATRSLGHPPAPTLIEREPATQLLHFSSTGVTEDDATSSANALASAFVKQEVERTRAAARRAVDQTSAAIEATRDRLSALSTTTTSGVAERTALTQGLIAQLGRLDTAQRGLQEASLAAVVSTRATEAVPASPFTLPTLVVLGVVLGGVLGLAVAAIREQASEVPHDHSDIAAAYPAVPVVGAVGTERRLSRLGSTSWLSRRFRKGGPSEVDLTAAHVGRALVDRHRRDGTTIVLVVSALGESDTSRVTRKLGEALAETGQSTVAVMRGEVPTVAPFDEPSMHAGESIAALPRWAPTSSNGSSGERAMEVSPARRTRRSHSRDGGAAVQPVAVAAGWASTEVPRQQGNLSVVQVEPGVQDADPIVAVEDALAKLRTRGRWIVVEGPAVLSSPVYEPVVAAAEAVVLAISSDRTTWQVLGEAVAAVEESRGNLLGIVQT